MRLVTDARFEQPAEHILRGPFALRHVEDVARAAAVIGLERKQPESFGMKCTLIAFDGVNELGRADIDGVVVAARDQVVIDAYGGIDRMPEQADILLGRRVA